MQDKIEKYEVIKKLGKQLFTQSNVVKTGNVVQGDVEIAKQFLAKAVTAVNPEVMASFFEHVMIAPELGRRIAKEYSSSKVEKNSSRQARTINVQEVEFLLRLHEIGRLVDPGGYLRNDVIDERLLTEFGLPKSLIQNLPPVRTFLQVGKMLDLDKEQLQGRKSLNKEQEKIASDYFNLFTPTRRIIFLADNFGKRDNKGKLFSLETFLHYVRTQDERYKGNRDWALDRMPAGSILTIFIIEKTIEWLTSLGVNLEKVLQNLENFGPRFVLVVRHGNIANPKQIVYNRDEAMKPEDVIHLSGLGKRQLISLGEFIRKRKFTAQKIYYSPQTRAIESAQALNSTLNVKDMEQNNDLNEVCAPGAYMEGINIHDWETTLKGNAYDKKRWQKYQHEDEYQVIDRVSKIFWETVKLLKVGGAAILLSHGDPIAWWINSLVSGAIPEPEKLRSLIYPDKGEAIVAIIDPQGKFFTYYRLR